MNGMVVTEGQRYSCRLLLFENPAERCRRGDLYITGAVDFVVIGSNQPITVLYEQEGCWVRAKIMRWMMVTML